jgi:FixJ family two-component response regulator
VPNSTNTKPRLVAVVENDVRVLQALGNLIESAGYEVALFESAAAFLGSEPAIDTLACLISDVDLNGMDGFQLQQILWQRRPAVPVILISGRFASTDPRAAGPNNRGMFEKPIDSDLLLNAIRQSVTAEQD